MLRASLDLPVSFLPVKRLFAVWILLGWNIDDHRLGYGATLVSLMVLMRASLSLSLLLSFAGHGGGGEISPRLWWYWGYGHHQIFGPWWDSMHPQRHNGHLCTYCCRLMPPKGRQKQGTNYCGGQPTYLPRRSHHKISRPPNINMHVELCHKHPRGPMHGRRCWQFLPYHPMERYEYMQIPIKLNPQSFINKHILHNEQGKTWVYLLWNLSVECTDYPRHRTCQWPPQEVESSMQHISWQRYATTTEYQLTGMAHSTVESPSNGIMTKATLTSQYQTTSPKKSQSTTIAHAEIDKFVQWN